MFDTLLGRGFAAKRCGSCFCNVGFFFFVGFGEFNGFGNGGWQQIGYIQAQESSGYCEEEEEGCCWVFEERHRGAA